MMQRRDIRAFGMTALHRLFELLRIADQHDAPRGLRHRQNIRERHLRGFVDEENVDCVCGIGERPKPCRSARHVAVVRQWR